MAGIGPIEMLIVGAVCFLFLGLPVIAIVAVVWISRRDRERREEMKEPPRP